MEDSGAILCQISSLKDMLDQVNDEIEANIQITREIESEIVKCSEIETALALRESELTKTLYVSHFEINGFAIVTANSRASLNCLEKELCCARMKRDEMLRRINDKREGFTTLCLEFQRDIDIGKNDELRALLSEKDLLENEIHLLDKKNNALKNSMLAFVEEILEDLHKSNSALQVEIQTGNQENEKLLKDIDDLQKLLLSTVMADDDHWFTIIVIDIIIYHGGPLNNANANKGFPFEKSGIKCYYTQIDRRLKTLDELKMIVMKELCVNPTMHNIQITYRSPHEVFKHRINYKYMAIEADKHVKIMFDKMERIIQVSAIELYIKLELRAEVSVEEIQQITTSLQVTVPDTQYEYFTHVKDDDDDDHDDNDDDDGDDDDDDDDYVDETIINGEDFVDRDEYEEMIERGDFERNIKRDIDDDEIFDLSETDADNVIIVQNITNTVPAYVPPTLSFSTNTWANIVDLSNIEIPFVSTWKEGINLSKWLTFANKVEVNRALTIYVLKENKHFVICRSTNVKLCAKCMDESCKWYVTVVMKLKFHGLWMVTVYVGPHMCIPIGLQNDGRMMNSNLIASDILKKLDEDHITPIKHLRSMMESKYDGHKLSYYKVWNAKQKAIGKIFGNWKESYQKLQKLLLAYVD